MTGKLGLDGVFSVSSLTALPQPLASGRGVSVLRSTRRRFCLPKRGKDKPSVHKTALCGLPLSSLMWLQVTNTARSWFIPLLIRKSVAVGNLNG